MAFEFKPGAPKQSQGLTLPQLKAKVAAGEKIESWKDVGGAVIKIFLDGSENAYLKDTATLRRFLSKI